MNGDEMNAKLTLTIDQSIIEKAKQYAKSQDRSLSDLIESYLMFVTNSNKKEEIDSEVSPIVQSMLGSLKMSKDYDIKEVKMERLLKKYNT